MVNVALTAFQKHSQKCFVCHDAALPSGYTATWAGLKVWATEFK